MSVRRFKVVLITADILPATPFPDVHRRRLRLILLHYLT